MRTPIPPEIAAGVLYASDMTCCVCNERGSPTQIHHIDGNSKNSEFENLAVLCLLCHNKTQLDGGFGRHLSPELVARYRSDWLERVKRRREAADASLVTAFVGRIGESGYYHHEDQDSEVSADHRRLIAFVSALPTIMREASIAAHDIELRGSTRDMVDANYGLIEELKAMLLRLSDWYPKGQFLSEGSGNCVEDVIANLFRWHHLHHSTSGLGRSGSIVGPFTAISVAADMKKMVEDMVSSLLYGDITGQQFDFDMWLNHWRDASAV
jgi:hypothetical protein